MTVSLSRTGIILSSTEAVLPTMACLASHPEGKKVADAGGCLPDGYDYDKLASSLRSIKSRHQKTSAMFLAADATVQYDALIRVMDVSRNARCSDIGEMSAKCDDGKDRTCGIPGGTCRKDGNAFYCECPLFPDVAFAAIQ
jgi:hypothetical protein